ncbi:MAG: hypothetical protein E3J72_04130 [Planctomycetota bacterium]|nr:MAG: hypothetical protein E3J72_04130 [Planctomycetota bacterium]
MKLFLAIKLVPAVVLLCVGCAQTVKPESEGPEISDSSGSILKVANFVRIRDFILGQGRRQTYCNMFNNNPYWGFSDFNAYLNPPDQGNINCEIGKSEFNNLVIQVTAPAPFRYWDIQFDQTGNRLHVRQRHSEKESHVLAREAADFFRKALAEIDRQAARGATR